MRSSQGGSWLPSWLCCATDRFVEDLLSRITVKTQDEYVLFRAILPGAE